MWATPEGVHGLGEDGWVFKIGNNQLGVGETSGLLSHCMS